MRILELEKLFKEEETLDKVLEEMKDDFEKVDLRINQYELGSYQKLIQLNPNFNLQTRGVITNQTQPWAKPTRTTNPSIRTQKSESSA